MTGVSLGGLERDHGRGGGEGQILDGGVRLRTDLGNQIHRISIHITPWSIYKIATHNH